MEETSGIGGVWAEEERRDEWVEAGGFKVNGIAKGLGSTWRTCSWSASSRLGEKTLISQFEDWIRLMAPNRNLPAA